MSHPCKYTIEDLRSYAAAKGGECLSTTYNGTKAAYQWRCANGHEWVAQAGPIIRRGTWCLKCALVRYTIDDLRSYAAAKGGECLSTTYNGVNSLYLWRCGINHEWVARAAPIIRRGVWCPNCARDSSGIKIRDFALRTRGSLVDHHPDITSEWDRELNAVAPNEISPKSSRKVWWKCSRGHRWEATVASRTYMHCGCPQCTSKTSRFELCIFAELKGLYGDVTWRSKFFGMECDIYIQTIKLGIEIDGGYWHANSLGRDRFKTERFLVEGLRLLRVRDKRLPEIHGAMVQYNNREQPLTVARRVVEWIYEHYPTPGLGKYLTSRRHLGKQLYQVMQANLPGPPPGQSLIDTHPAVASEWDSATNHPLIPSMFSYGSNFAAFWKCQCGHTWRANIYSRTALRAGCPRCGQKKSVQGRRATLLSTGRSFAARHPELLHQWAHDKNGLTDPQFIMAGSEKKRYWWRCERGHEWQATCKARHTGYGCPACALQTRGDRRRQGDLKRRGTSLAVLYPHLVDEWDRPKNTLAPDQVLPKSAYRAHWKCSKGHEWQAVVASRTAGNGCPKCKGLNFADAVVQRALNKSGSLANVLNSLPFELLDIECADRVTPGSKTIVRWRCSAAHVFPRAIC